MVTASFEIVLPVLFSLVCLHFNVKQIEDTFNEPLSVHATVEVDWFHQNHSFNSVDYLHCWRICARFSQFTFNWQCKIPNLETNLQNPVHLFTCSPLQYFCRLGHKCLTQNCKHCAAICWDSCPTVFVHEN